MNTFVTIKHIEDYEEVSYYSICFEGDEVSLFENFILKFHNSKHKEELLQITEWIERIGNEIGAISRYFRHEGRGSDAKALPPPTKYLTGDAGQLRLYCMIANKHVVFLYDGDVKTTDLAQDCPNVAPKFHLANKLTSAINQAFFEREIQWSYYDDDIEFSEELELEI